MASRIGTMQVVTLQDFLEDMNRDHTSFTGFGQEDAMARGCHILRLCEFKNIIS